MMNSPRRALDEGPIEPGQKDRTSEILAGTYTPAFLLAVGVGNLVDPPARGTEYLA